MDCIGTGCKREGLQKLLDEKSSQLETLLRAITDARCLIDPIWREMMGAESVREHVQRGLRCIDSAITDCRFTVPNTAGHRLDRIERC